jgi:hypothetical protein
MNYDITRDPNYRPLTAADAPGNHYDATPEGLRRRQGQQQAAIERLFLTRQISYAEYMNALARGKDLDVTLAELQDLVVAREAQGA